MFLDMPEGETLKLVQKNLNENDETREQYLAHIKEWLKNEPHLPDEFDEQRLLTFLRSCKFSLERCKQKLDTYFTVRAALPELFTNRDIQQPEMQNTLNSLYLAVLPGVTPEGYRISLMAGKHAKGKDFDFLNVIKYIFMMGDVRLAEENIIGDIYIFDMLKTHPSYFVKLTPSLFKKTMLCAVEAYPVRLKAIHMINVWPWLKIIIESLKPFIKEKIWTRLFIHSDASKLYKYVPAELLPTEYGGNAGCIHDLHTKWMRHIGEHTNWFKEQENVKAEESLRRDKSTKYDEVFGAHGSFQQLSID